MRRPQTRSTDETSRDKGKRGDSATTASETDSLLQRRNHTETHGGSIRARRSSRSPTVSVDHHFGSTEQQHQPNDQMNIGLGDESTSKSELTQDYNAIQDTIERAGSVGEQSRITTSSSRSQRSIISLRRQNYRVEKTGASFGTPLPGNPPLLEIPEEVYSIRKSALQVLKPLTKTWLVVSVGFALTVLFGMARWTRLLHDLPYWFILLPSWLSHLGLFWCHLMSAKALSTFIAEANDSRQRPDSRDHLDRTEYLPLLQRSLKFGLKTGLLSFGIFVFEILIYIKLARGKLSLMWSFTPLWLLVIGGILDGIICKTQHFVRLVCWLLTFAAMVLTVMKADYGFNHIRWGMVVSPIVAVLLISFASLIYIVYGHQVGYYRLTESQLTAGNLYSLAALICIVLVVMVGEVIPLARPVEIETRIFVVVMAPLVVTLVGMGAWVISRDEFGRLLLYGGQAAVHPRKLRWEADGWTSIQGRGVTNIPMFGEVSYRPLEKKPISNIEVCMCCSCYPYEEEEEEIVQYSNGVSRHPYLAPTNSGNTLRTSVTYSQPNDSGHGEAV